MYSAGYIDVESSFSSWHHPFHARLGLLDCITMCDDDRDSRESTTISISPDDSLYTPTRSSSTYLNSNPARCVCNLSVRLLQREHRWVGNAESLYECVGDCRSFHDEVDNGFFPFVLGEKCVDVGSARPARVTDDDEVDLEYYADEVNVHCVACSDAGKSAASFKMYQSVLRFAYAKDGYTRPHLVSVICCIMERCDIDTIRLGSWTFMNWTRHTVVSYGAWTIRKQNLNKARYLVFGVLVVPTAD